MLKANWEFLIRRMMTFRQHVPWRVMLLCPCMFSYGWILYFSLSGGRLMFLEADSQGPLCLTNVLLPSAARDFVHYSSPAQHWVTLVSCHCRVEMVVNVFLMSYVLHTFLTSSLLTHMVCRYLGASSGSLSLNIKWPPDGEVIHSRTCMGTAASPFMGRDHHTWAGELKWHSVDQGGVLHSSSWPTE